MNIVWSIAGSDSSAGAGIQADLATFKDFNVHGCTAIAVLTAQNSMGVKAASYVDGMMLNHQINALKHDMPAKAIKLGLLGSTENLKAVNLFLQEYKGPIVADPVFMATTGAQLVDKEVSALYRRYIFPYITLLTPNVAEIKALTGIELNKPEDYELAAKKLLFMGCKAVLIKSGDANWDPMLSSDYYADDRKSFWINQYRINTNHTHGTGCALSSAICACLALNYSLPDAIVLAKAYIQTGLKAAIALGKGHGAIAHTGFPNNAVDFPWISQKPEELCPEFPTNRQSLGLYPLVNNLEDLKFCIKQGFNTVQLRVKNVEQDLLKKIIIEAVKMTKNTDTQLYINDHWQLAIEAKAYGVHLGQEDLLTVNMNAIRDAGLRLGIGSNCLFSLAKAYAFNPSYLAVGPVFSTNSKPDTKSPIGSEKLKIMASLSPKPLCAIGGIKEREFEKLRSYGCEGIAFIAELQKMKARASSLDEPAF